MNAAQPLAWSQHGRCCGSGRRSGAAVGVRRASWPWLQILTGSPPRQHSRACAEGDPRCKPSAGPEGRSGRGPTSLGTGAGAGLGLSYVSYIEINPNHKWAISLCGTAEDMKHEQKGLINSDDPGHQMLDQHQMDDFNNFTNRGNNKRIAAVRITF